MALTDVLTQIDITGGGAKSNSATQGKSLFGVSNFLAEVRNSGLSKANRFEIEITLPEFIIAMLGKSTAKNSTNIANLYADTAFMPMTRIITGRQQLFGPPEYFPIGVDYGGDNMGFNFYLDRQYNIKRFFDTWIDNIVTKTNPDSAAPQFTTRYSRDYKTPMIRIKQLDEQDHVMYSAQLIDAFPVAINVITLDHNLQNQPSRLNVTFNYRYWISNGISAPQQPLSTKGIFDWSIFSGFGSNGSGGNAIQSPSLQPGFDPFHPDTSPASEAYWLKK